MTFKEFISNCDAKGGNWVAMYESGIKRLWPEEYEELINSSDYRDADGREQWLMLDNFLKSKGI